LDLYEIQQLANLVKDADLYELEIERGNMRVKIVNSGNVAAHGVASGVPTGHTGDGYCHTLVREDKVSQVAQLENDANCHIIRSPVVGTFYSAPSPESPDFVAKNSPINADSVVCIIEAMKVMNEIQAEVAGVVEDVLVENGQPVEFGQPLFKIKKS
jgi:acetyl-CoA carboxylase biotin carboxyl carrier protein